MQKLPQARYTNLYEHLPNDPSFEDCTDV